MFSQLMLASVILSPQQGPATPPSVIVVPSAAFPTIRSGVAEAYRRNARDEVLVLPGVYRLTRTLHLTGRVRIRSAAGPKRTIIDGGSRLRCIWIMGGTRDILIEGFTVQNGSASFYGGGIAMIDACPTLRNCVFVNNFSLAAGAAISIVGFKVAASPLIEDCRFEGNTVWHNAGGAIQLSAVQPREGPVPDHRPVIRRCQFIGNKTLNLRNPFGGAFAFGEGNITISDCLFTGNGASGPGRGVVGSLVSYQGNKRGTTCHLINCILTENQAKKSILDVVGATVTLTNCVIFDSNRMPAVDLQSFPFLPHAAKLVASNSVLWTMGSSEIVNRGASSVRVTYSDVRGGVAGQGNINKDPVFANAASGNARLLPGSPCIDAGTARNVPRLPKRDFEGDPRWIGPAVDIGADEWNPSARLLWTDRARVTSNAPVRIVINVQARQPSEAFIALPSLSGTKPGFSVGRVHIPLNPDGITTAFWRQLLGTVDARGRGQRLLSLSWVPRELAGRNVSFAAVFLEFRPKGVLLGASNVDTVKIR